MAKLADLRSNLSKEEKEEYEKYKSNANLLETSESNPEAGGDAMNIDADPNASPISDTQDDDVKPLGEKPGR